MGVVARFIAPFLAPEGLCRLSPGLKPRDFPGDALMTELASVRVRRYGVDAALPARRTLRAGPLTAVLENADLRYVRFGDAQVVLRLYMAVRNRNWDTVEPVFTNFQVDDRGDGFLVTFTAEHVAGEVDFAWSGV